MALAPFGCPVRLIAFSGQRALGRRLPSGFGPVIAILGFWAFLRDKRPAAACKQRAAHDGANWRATHLLACSVVRKHIHLKLKLVRG